MLSDDFLKSATKRIVADLSFDQGWVHLLDKGNNLILKTHQSLTSDQVNVLNNINFSDLKLPQIISFKKTSLINRNFRKAAKLANLSTLVVLPLNYQKNILGTLSLGSVKQEIPYYDLSALELISDQIGLAYENAKLHEQAVGIQRIDGLTGLYNFHYFKEVLEKEISKSIKNEADLSLLLIDISNLKAVNDYYGYESGDFVLRKLGDLLKNESPKQILARYGDDKFVLLLRSSNLKKAKEMAHNVVQKAKTIKMLGFDKKFTINVLVGIAHCSKPPVNSSAFINAAKISLDKQKRVKKLKAS